MLRCTALLARLALAVWCGFAGPSSAHAQEDSLLTLQEPSFIEGDVAELKAKLARVEKVGKQVSGSCLLWIEVANESKTFAEPMAFVVELNGLPDSTRRSLKSRFAEGGPHCAGRAIPPGSSREYPILCGFDAEVADQLELGVARASFFEHDPGNIEAPLEVRSLRTDRISHPEFVDPQMHSYITLENATAHEIEGVFLLELEGQLQDFTLVRARLKPGQRREIDEWMNDYLYGFNGSKARLIDWTVIFDEGEQLAREKLLEAMSELRGRWPEERELGARFVMQEAFPRTLRSAGYVEVGRDGEAKVEPDGDPGTKSLDLFEELIDQLQLVASMPTAEELKSELPAMRLVALGDEVVVHLQRDALFNHAQPLYYGLREGRIAWYGVDHDGGPFATIVRSVEAGDGWAITGWGRREPESGKLKLQAQLEYAELGDWLVPTHVAYDMDMFGEDWDRRATLQLSSHVRDPAAGPSRVLPAGPLAEALSAAWQAGYRYPEEPVTLSGRFQLKTQGGPAWKGQRKLSGTFELQGFHGSSWARGSVQLGKSKLAESEAEELELLLIDRLHMWRRRDPGGWPSFNDAFLGCTLSGSETSIDLSGCLYSHIELEDGRVKQLTLRGGTERSFTYRMLGSHSVPSSVRSVMPGKAAHEEYRVTFKRIGKQWVLPTKLQMKNLGGVEGVDETLTLSKLKVQ